MAFPYDSSYSDWEATVNSRYVCRRCGLMSLSMEDGCCQYCNDPDPENRANAVRAANRAAWDKVRRERPELFK